MMNPHSHNPAIPDDLYPLYVAHGTGEASQRAGFRLTTNPYAPDRMPLAALPREERLKAWAWALGWRVAAWCANKAIEETRKPANMAERMREGRL
jgi:hypothetical protein